MFGVIAAGRMIDTNLTQVDATKYLVQLHDAKSINHLVVFLLGTIPFPPNFGASVHFLWPSPNPSWIFLGILTNEKPSAIFKLGGGRGKSDSAARMPSKSTDDLMEEDYGPFAATVETIAQIGISIEPLDQVLQAQEAHNAKNGMSLTFHQPLPTNIDIAHRLLESLYNYLTSFATTVIPPEGMNLFQAISINPSIMDSSYIPVKAIMEWYKNTLHKIEADPQTFSRPLANHSEMDTSFKLDNYIVAMLSELQDPPKKSLTMQMNPQMFRPQQLQQLTPQQQQLLMQQRQAQQQQLFQQQQFQKQQQMQQQQSQQQQQPRKKPNEKNLPKKIDQYVPDAKLYMQMQEFERRLDATITRKMLDVQDALSKPLKRVPRTLRLFLSNLSANQESPDVNDPSSISIDRTPSWTFKLQGKLLDLPGQRKNMDHAQPKFSSFFKRIVVEVERDASFSGNIIEWHNTPGSAEVDGFEIKRHGDTEVDLKILLFLENVPEKHKLSPPLAKLLDTHTDTLSNVIMGLWQYVKRNKLQDGEDRRIMVCDEKLLQIFQMPKVPFTSLPSLLTKHLLPCDPIILSYTVRVDKEYHMNESAFDIQVFTNDTMREKCVQLAQAALPHQRELTALDEKISATVQAITVSKIKRDFMRAFADDPVRFINQWMASQSRDLEVLLGDTRVNLAEAQSTEFFEKQDFKEALFHYLRSKDVQ